MAGVPTATRGEELDLVVVGDQGELVGWGEPPDQERRALLGGLELRPGHGPGAVDDQGEVKRRPLVGGGRGRRYELEHGVDAVLGLDGQQVVFESDGCLQLRSDLLRWVVSSFDPIVRNITDRNDSGVIQLDGLERSAAGSKAAVSDPRSTLSLPRPTFKRNEPFKQEPVV